MKNIRKIMSNNEIKKSIDMIQNRVKDDTVIRN